MKSRFVAALMLVTFASASVSAPAFAQAGNDDPTTKQARARFQEGVDYFDKKQFDNARASFLQAYALKKHPAVLLNLAQSCLKAGHALEAAKYFQQFLRESSQITSAQRSDAESGLADARSKIGRIDVSAPSGAEVFIDKDDQRAGTAPLSDSLDVDPGSHTVRIKKSDGTTETQTVSVSSGQRVAARFGGEKPPEAAVAATPSPAPAANAPAESNGEPPTGEITISTKSGLFSPPQNMTPVYIGLGVGAAGLVGAVAFGIAKASAQSKADGVANEIRTAAAKDGLSTTGVCNNTAAGPNYAGACEALKSNNSTVNTDATIANISVAVMGVGIVTAAGFYLFGTKRDANANATWKPVITPEWGTTKGVNLSAKF